MSTNVRLLFSITSMCIAVNGFLETSSSTSQLIYQNVKHLNLALKLHFIMGILHILWPTLCYIALNNMRILVLYAYCGGLLLFSAINLYLLYVLSPIGMEKVVAILSIFIQQLAVSAGLQIAHSQEENVQKNVPPHNLN